mgnify:CR=1 FL=1
MSTSLNNDPLSAVSGPYTSLKTLALLTGVSYSTLRSYYHDGSITRIEDARVLSTAIDRRLEKALEDYIPRGSYNLIPHISFRSLRVFVDGNPEPEVMPATHLASVYGVLLPSDAELDIDGFFPDVLRAYCEAEAEEIPLEEAIALLNDAEVEEAVAAAVEEQVGGLVDDADYEVVSDEEDAGEATELVVTNDAPIGALSADRSSAPRPIRSQQMSQSVRSAMGAPLGGLAGDLSKGLSGGLAGQPAPPSRRVKEEKPRLPAGSRKDLATTPPPSRFERFLSKVMAFFRGLGS